MADLPVKSLGRRDGELFLVSVLILFLELVLIRWIGTEIRIFAYLGNLILVVCFFGVGLGCYLSARPIVLKGAAVRLLILAALVANPLHAWFLDVRQVTWLLSGFEDFNVWGGMSQSAGVFAVAGLAIVAVLMYLIAFAFVPVGQMLGRAFAQHPQTIRAYSVNIAGSLAGVWLFNALSWLSVPPPIWFAAVAALLAPLVVDELRSRWFVLGSLAVASMLVWVGNISPNEIYWSPYHKITISPCYADEATRQIQQGYSLEVNGTFYQHMLDLSDKFVQANARVIDPERVRRGHYSLPFVFQPGAKRMLAVGAGSGNDAAAALRHGLEQVDCVEIDPKIYELGKRLHPEHPYDSPKVRMLVNDARAYFKQATGPYDIVWFGWLDSHTNGSNYNNLRLDHYVYTRESFQEAKRLLADDGVMILSFSADKPWIADRLYHIMAEVFGHEPLAYSVSLEEIPRECGGGGNITLVSAKNPVTLDRVADPVLREFIRSHPLKTSAASRVSTDDWPYLYLESAKVPKLHLFTMLAILGTVALARKRVLGMTRGLDWHFFALGAAFLLLEVQTVSRATLLFGMTWVVNAIVISAVLVMILWANLVAATVRRVPQWLIVIGLAATVIALAVVPLEWFNTLTGASKLIAASAFLTAPVFFAGLIFIRSFAACADKAQALGSNLIGALLGGLLESLSFMTGIRALVVLVGLFYVLALCLRPKTAAEPIAT